MDPSQVRRFSSHNEWIRYCQRLVSHDQDSVTWYSGKAGSGKSILSLLFNRRLDPTFSARVIAGEPAIAFNNLDFLRATVTTEPAQVVDGDELSLFARGVMRAEQMALVEWLKDSRGLNLHVGMKFPEEDLVDEKTILFRAMWRVHTYHDHTYQLFVPREPHLRDDSIPFGNWREVFKSTFPDLQGPLREAYRAQKQAHMRQAATSLVEKLERIEDKRAGRKPSKSAREPTSSGEDVVAATGLPRWDPKR